MRLDGMRLDDEQAIDEAFEALALASQHPSFTDLQDDRRTPPIVREGTRATAAGARSALRA